MLVNGCTWNVCYEINGIVQEMVANFNLRVYVAEVMLIWIDLIEKSIVLPLCQLVGAIQLPVVDISCTNIKQCIVCGLETCI